MEKIVIEPEDIELTKRCAKVFNDLLKLPNDGEFFPSFDTTELVYGVTPEIAVFIEDNKVNLALYYSNGETEDYAKYHLDIESYADTAELIQNHINQHNEIYETI